MYNIFILCIPFGIITLGFFFTESIIALILGIMFSIIFFNMSILINKISDYSYIIHSCFAFYPMIIGFIKNDIIKGIVITILLNLTLIINLLCLKIKVEEVPETHSLPDLNRVVTEPLPLYTPKLPDYSEN